MRPYGVCFLWLMAVSALAAPTIDNNAGIWHDAYSDNLGVAAFDRTVQDGVGGVVRLAPGEAQGNYTTVVIKPASFDAWGTLTLTGVWSAPADVQLTLLDPLNADAVLIGPVDYTGPFSLAGVDPVTHPELKVRVTLIAGAVQPAVGSLRVTWNPTSVLLATLHAPEQVPAGASIPYRIQYSVNFVAVHDLVVWSPLPTAASGTITYPADYGQNDGVTFVSATGGGQFTAAPVSVRGVSIPAGTVYWDLGDKAEGTTESLTFVLRSANGSLSGTVVTGTAVAAAGNATAFTSQPYETVLQSVAAPVLNKLTGAGAFRLSTGTFTLPGNLITFQVQAGNSSGSAGLETLYETVVHDDLSGLSGLVVPDRGGAGIPVTDIAPIGGAYVADFVPPGGGTPIPAVVWNVGTLPPGASFSGSFRVQLLDAPPLPATGQLVNTARMHAANLTAPQHASRVVLWPLDQTPEAVLALGDNVDSVFQITRGKNDDAGLYVNPGATFPYGFSVRNTGLVALRGVLVFNKIPADSAFRSAWFNDAWLQANGTIFYSMLETANATTPPAYDYRQAPAGLDVAGDAVWLRYDLHPPAALEDVKWLAFHVPAVNSAGRDSSQSGWVAGAPQAALGYFDVTISPTILGDSPCVERTLTSRALLRVHEIEPLSGGAPVALSPVLSDHDLEYTRVSIDKAALSVRGSVDQALLNGPDEVTYTVRVTNIGKALAGNVGLEMTWPRVPVNGVLQLLPFFGIQPASVSSFDPSNGRLVLSLGNLPPGQSRTASLTVRAPAGLDDGQQLTFTSRATAQADCPVPAAASQASAVARFLPTLRVFKQDVLDLIPSAGELDYTLTLFNTGHAPSYGTFMIERLPPEMVLLHATGPRGERLWFSDIDNLPPSYMTPTEPIDKGDIAARFSPGILNENGTSADSSDDVWLSPFGTRTRWVAWEMDDARFTPALFPVGNIRTVGLRLKNDADGVGPGVEGSSEGTQIFGTTGVFSDELVLAIGNEVVTTVREAPSLLVQKDGPAVVGTGSSFEWTVNYYNNSGTPSEGVTITDTLPAGASLVSATHRWNPVALANGAPVNNNGQAVPGDVVINPDGTSTVTFTIAGDTGYRGNSVALASLEGGMLTLTVQVAPGMPSNSEILNRVQGTASSGAEVSSSSAEHLVLIRNAELRLTKLSSPARPVAGDTVTYNLIVANMGLREAEHVVLTDTLPSNLDFLAGSVLVLTPGYSVGPPLISGRTLTWSGGNALTKAPLPAGQIEAFSGDIVIQYQARVAPGTPAGTVLANAAAVATQTPEDGSEPNEAVATVSTPNPDLTIFKSGLDLANPGDRLTWKLTYYNSSRQAAGQVWIVDTLPDYDGDGEADVTFAGQRAPAGVVAYYHAGPSSPVPAFDVLAPATGGWRATPTTPVNHVAWSIGALAGESVPAEIAVTADAVRPNGGAPVLVPAGVALENAATIHSLDEDDDLSNNVASHVTRMPGNDISLTKSGSVEGIFPGVRPDEGVRYMLRVENAGNQIAYGLEVRDTLSAGLAFDDPVDNLFEVRLTDADGAPVLPVDATGTPVGAPVAVTRVVEGAMVRWYWGTTNATDAHYYRHIGLPPGAGQHVEVYARVNRDVGYGTDVENTASAILHNRNDADPPELYLDNNTDSSTVRVWLPDLDIRKVVQDTATGSSQQTEAGYVLEYRIEYNNLGNAAADNVVISEIVPAGTSLIGISSPPGATVSLFPPGAPAAAAERFDINLGTVRAPSGFAGVVENLCLLGTKSARLLANGTNGIPDGALSSAAGFLVQGLGDVDGDGVPDLVSGQNVILLHPDGTAKAVILFLEGETLGWSVAVIGDVDGNGVNDLAAGAPENDRGGTDSGGAWVVLLNSDGTTKATIELANGTNGIPAASFLANDRVGMALGAAGDVDGDGIPDLVLGTPNPHWENSDSGGAWVILLHADGTAKSAIQLANGKNGIPAGAFHEEDEVGVSIASLGDVDGDGVPDLLLGAPRTSINLIREGGAWIILLNTNGTAKSAVQLANGRNGIPMGAFQYEEEVGTAVAALGDVDGDGIPDLVLSAHQKNYAGGAWVILLNPDGTAKAAIELANDTNGIPAGSFRLDDQVGITVALAGDLDGDGIPDLLVGAPRMGDGGYNAGGAWLIPLQRDGTAKTAIKLSNGNNGIPEGSFLPEGRVGVAAVPIGDVNGDGTDDLLLGQAYVSDGVDFTGGLWVLLTERAPCTQPGRPGSLLDGSQVHGGQLSVQDRPGVVMSAVELANGLNGIPVGSFLAFDRIGISVASAGDVDGDGVPDLVLGASNNDDGGSDAGGAWVVLLNSDGTTKAAIELANGKNGIPAESFRTVDYTGETVVSLGDVDGDGVPDLLLSARGMLNRGFLSTPNTGGAWVVLLNSGGTAKSAIKLANGHNGIPDDAFPSRKGTGFRVAALGDVDGDGVPDAMLSASGYDNGALDSGGAWIILLNSDGTPKSMILLANGTSGIPADAFMEGDLTGRTMASLGDVDGDGMPDIVLGAQLDDGGLDAGGAWVILLNADGTAKSAVKLANGINGIPAASFPTGALAGRSVAAIGDIDGDGVPDLAIGGQLVPDSEAGLPSAAPLWIILLNPDGTAKSVIELGNGLNGIPAESFDIDEGVGHSITALGDVDGDGVPDLLLGNTYRVGFDWNPGGAWVILLNADGSAKETIKLANGMNRVPNNAFLAGDAVGFSVAALGDLAGDGRTHIALGGFGKDNGANNAGGVWVFGLNHANRHHTHGSYEAPMIGRDVATWDRLISESDAPDGTELTYSFGRRQSDGSVLYDIAGFQNIPGPLPDAGLDISGLDPAQEHVLKVDFRATDPLFTPTLHNWVATYQSASWPFFTFTVRVQHPVPAAVLPGIDNRVSIRTSTPETREENNQAAAATLVNMTDLGLTATADALAVLEEEPVGVTLDWINNGPLDAPAVVLTHTLPVGITFATATKVPDSIDGQTLVWELGDLALGASGSIRVNATVDSGTAGQTLIAASAISTPRQETEYANNQASIPVVVNTLANVHIAKRGPATVRLGGLATYTLDYGNNGNTAAADVRITDTLPDGLQFVDAVPPPDAQNGQVYTWTRGALDGGTTGTITVTTQAGLDYIALHNRTRVNTATITTTSVELRQTDNQAAHTITLLGSPAAIGGTVWIDSNADGVFDSDESGLAGITITVTGTNVLGGGVHQTAPTIADGTYSFTGLTPGTYTLIETRPAGYIGTADLLGTVYQTTTPGVTNGVNADPLDGMLASIILGPGERGIRYDFGLSLVDAPDVGIPGIALLGVNGALITSGTAASVAHGTRFGPVLPGGGWLTSTLAITNSGTATLVISGGVTGGVDAAYVSVANLPMTLPSGAVSNFSVAFNSADEGTFEAWLDISHNAPLDPSPYRLRLSGLVDGTPPRVTVIHQTINIITNAGNAQTLDILFDAQDASAVASLVATTFRDYGEYVGSGAGDDWFIEQMPLHHGPNRITLVAADALGNTGTNTFMVDIDDNLYNATLRSGALMTHIDIPDYLVPGTVTNIAWSVLSYVPVRARIGAGLGGTNGWVFFRNGVFEGVQESNWKINGRAAKVYSFSCDWPVPEKSGDFNIWFNHSQMDGALSLSSVIADGLDPRPAIAQSKLIERTITGFADGAVPVSEAPFYEAEHVFEFLPEYRRRSGGTVTSVDLPATLTTGAGASASWKVLSYVPLRSKFHIVNVDQAIFFTTNGINGIEGTLTGTPVLSDWRFAAGGTVYQATEYTFRADFTIPANAVGTNQIYFLNQDQTEVNSSWMSGNIDAGADPQPYEHNGITGRFIERVIEPGNN